MMNDKAKHFPPGSHSCNGLQTASRRICEPERLADRRLRKRIRTIFKNYDAGIVAVSAAWCQVEESICDHASQADPRPTFFDVYHRIVLARDAFMNALNETGDVDMASVHGLARANKFQQQPAARDGTIDLPQSL